MSYHAQILQRLHLLGVQVKLDGSCYAGEGGALPTPDYPTDYGTVYVIKGGYNKLFLCVDTYGQVWSAAGVNSDSPTTQWIKLNE